MEMYIINADRIMQRDVFNSSKTMITPILILFDVERQYMDT